MAKLLKQNLSSTKTLTWLVIVLKIWISNIRIIKGTSDHVYGNYSTEYVDNAFKNEFKNANLKIVNITNANHAFKGYEKQCATYLFDAVNDLINIK